MTGWIQMDSQPGSATLLSARSVPSGDHDTGNAVCGSLVSRSTDSPLATLVMKTLVEPSRRDANARRAPTGAHTGHMLFPPNVARADVPRSLSSTQRSESDPLLTVTATYRPSGEMRGVVYAAAGNGRSCSVPRRSTQTSGCGVRGGAEP